MREFCLLALLLFALMTSCAPESKLVLPSPPTADFAAVPEEGPAPLAIIFTDLSLYLEIVLNPY